jgi:hypothetical protein
MTLVASASLPITISDPIADGAGSGGTGVGSLLVEGNGVVTLAAANSFSGGILLEGSGTLELGGSISAGTGTITFDTNAATLRIDGATAPANVIAGFILGDKIDLSGIAFSAADTLDYTVATGILAIENGTTTVAQLGFGAGNAAVDDAFQITQETGGGTGIVVTNELPCFLAGTMILTDRGEVAVQDLAVGQNIITLSGEVKPIVWIGSGHASISPSKRSAATPVIVRKNALAPNVPHRDLRITKGHSLFVDNVLIPVEFLVNHRSIEWDDRVGHVRFFHVEVADHDVLLADGAPAETYRDDGNRSLFDNTNDDWDQVPKPPCAPVLTGGSIVDAAWRRLLDRAGGRPGLPTTEEADLHLLVDGKRVDGAARPNGSLVFDLLHRPSEVRMMSRAGSPAELGLARDPRQLGVGIRAVQMWRGPKVRLLDASDDQLVAGFHAFEPDNAHRWTDGDATLPSSLFEDVDGPAQLVVVVSGTTRYPLLESA